MEVKLGAKFQCQFPNFPSADKLKIVQFIRHVEQYGFDGLEGKNRCSDGIPYDDPKYIYKMAYVRKHRLWHYHIGIPHYEQTLSGNYKTSEYVLHYMKGDDCIKIVDMSSHPPFRLPTKDYLE